MIPTVLIVDDNRVNRLAAMKVCGGIGVLSREATNGEEALRLVHQHRFSAVLLDLRMPGMSGEEVCGRIRADERVREIPIIAYTAHVQRADVARLLDAGFDAVLIKPVRFWDFERVLRGFGLLPP